MILSVQAHACLSQLDSHLMNYAMSMQKDLLSVNDLSHIYENSNCKRYFKIFKNSNFWILHYANSIDTQGKVNILGLDILNLLDSYIL